MARLKYGEAIGSKVATGYFFVCLVFCSFFYDDKVVGENCRNLARTNW